MNSFTHIPTAQATTPTTIKTKTPRTTDICNLSWKSSVQLDVLLFFFEQATLPVSLRLYGCVNASSYVISNFLLVFFFFFIVKMCASERGGGVYSAIATSVLLKHCEIDEEDSQYFAKQLLAFFESSKKEEEVSRRECEAAFGGGGASGMLQKSKRFYRVGSSTFTI